MPFCHYSQVSNVLLSVHINETLSGSNLCCKLSCVWLFCDPIDCSPPGSSVRGILQARILEWVAISSSMGSSWPRNWSHVSCISCRWVLYHWATGEAYETVWKVLVAQSGQTLSDPMVCSPSGSSVQGILQARILEWVAISFSRESSQPRDWTQVSCIADRFFTVWATREALI